MTRPITRTITLAAASANGIALSQSPGAAGNLTLNGALVTGGVAYLGAGRRVIVTSGGDDTGKIFTVYGTNDSGTPIVEAFAGASGGAAASTQNFFTVTQVAISAASAGTVTVGTNGVGSSAPVLVDDYGDAALSVQVDVTGTVSYTVEATLDNPLGPEPFIPPLAAPFPVWFSNSTLWSTTEDMTSNAASAQSTMLVKPKALRLTINSGDGTAKMTVIQAGVSGFR